MASKTVSIVLIVAVASTFAHPDVHGPVYKSEPKPYQFAYGVNDDYKGTHFSQKESSDGKNVYGSYIVALPDGRKQKVDYTADAYKGFVAKVSYEGKAQHPQTYGPAITFKPSYGNGASGAHGISKGLSHGTHGASIGHGGNHGISQGRGYGGNLNGIGHGTGFRGNHAVQGTGFRGNNAVRNHAVQGTGFGHHNGNGHNTAYGH